MNLFQRNAKLIVVLAMISGSTSGILGKLITAGSMTIGFYRLSFCLPFFIVPLLIKHRKDIIEINKKQLLLCALGGVFLFGHFFCWYVAVKNTVIASAIVLAGLHPIVVILFMFVFFRKRTPAKAMAGVLMALTGGILVAGMDYSFAGSNVFGNFMALGAAFCMGLYFCIGNIVREKMNAGVYIFLVFFFCWVCFATGMILTKTPFTGYPLSDYIWLIVMTLLCQFGAHAVLNWSLGYVSSLYVSAIETGEIVSAMILAFIVLSQVPTPWQMAGAAVVIIGLVYYNRHDLK